MTTHHTAYVVPASVEAMPSSHATSAANHAKPRLPRETSLTRGLGRSYGDASLPSRGDRIVADSTLADRLLAFDSETGLLMAEAGLSHYLEGLDHKFRRMGTSHTGAEQRE